MYNSVKNCSFEHNEIVYPFSTKILYDTIIVILHLQNCGSNNIAKDKDGTTWLQEVKN